MATVTPAAARRPRAYVRVQGPDAVDYLNRMLSNDVPESGSVDALLLTPKARVIAPVLVWRRGADDVLLLTEPELGEPLLAQLTRMRFAAKCEIAAEEHTSTIVFGEAGDGIPNRDYGQPAVEVLDAVAGRRGRRRARAAAHRRGDAALRPRDRRSRPARGGRPRGASDLVLQGLLSRAGADRPPALSRQGQPSPARARGERRRARARDACRLRREGGRPRHERGARPRARVRARRGSRGRRASGRRRDGARQGVQRQQPPCGPCSTAPQKSHPGRPGSMRVHCPTDAPVAQGIEHQLAELGVARSNRAGRITSLSQSDPRERCRLFVCRLHTRSRW